MSGFRKFLLRGNVVDLAVGIVIGAAFGAVVTAFVQAFLTPLVGLAAGATGDFSKSGFTVHHGHHQVTLFPYGAFINAIVSFILIAAFVYFLVVVPVNKLMERYKPTPEEPTPTQDCPHCLSSVPAAAAVCAFCTRDLAPAA